MKENNCCELQAYKLILVGWFRLESETTHQILKSVKDLVVNLYCVLRYCIIITRVFYFTSPFLSLFIKVTNKANPLITSYLINDAKPFKSDSSLYFA